MQAPDFWDNMEKAQGYVKELNTLKNVLDDFKELETQFDDVEVLLEMGYESEDPEIVAEVKEALDIFKGLRFYQLGTLVCNLFSRH